MPHTPMSAAVRSRPRRNAQSNSTVSLSKLQFTPEVKAAALVANNWPLLSLRAFLNQGVSDGEIATAVAIMNQAKQQGQALAALRYPEHAALYAALDTMSGEMGGQSPLQELCDAVFVLAAIYGLRLGGVVR